MWVRRRLVQVTVRGSSMAPTLVDGDRVLVVRRSLARVRRGQLVVLEPPLADGSRRDSGTTRIDRRLWQVKRAVALPGDAVPPGISNIGDAHRVPPGALVVLGDSAASVDSRQRGFYFATDLLGVVVTNNNGRSSHGRSHKPG